MLPVPLWWKVVEWLPQVPHQLLPIARSCQTLASLIPIPIPSAGWMTVKEIRNAVQRGDIAMVQYLHLNESMHNRHSECPEDEWVELKERLFLDGVDSGNINMCKYLLRNGIPMNTQGCLEQAASNNDIDMVRYLIPLVSVTSMVNGLSAAASRGCLSICRLLLAHIPVSQMPQCWPSICSSAASGHLDVCECLFACHVPITPEALQLAAQQGHHTLCHFFLSHGLTVQDLQWGEKSTLCRVAALGHIKVLKLLLRHTIAREQIGYALVAAACAGHTEAVKLLLNLDTNGHLHTILTHPIIVYSLPAHRHWDFWTFMAEHGWTLHMTQDYESLLYHTAAHGQLEWVQHICDTGLLTWRVATSSVLVSAGNGHIATCEYLIDKFQPYSTGAEFAMNQIIQGFATLEQYTSAHAHSALSDALLWWDTIQHAIIRTASHGSILALQTLMNRCKLTPENCCLALTWAAMNGHPVACQVLLKEVMPTSLQSAHNIILMSASQHGHASLLYLLQDHHFTDWQYEQWYVLRMAARSGHVAILQFLKRLPLPMEAIGVQDNYPLRWAARCGHTNVCQLLLKWGADIRAKHYYAIRWSYTKGYFRTCYFLSTVAFGKQQRLTNLPKIIPPME